MDDSALHFIDALAELMREASLCLGRTVCCLLYLPSVRMSGRAVMRAGVRVGKCVHARTCVRMRERARVGGAGGTSLAM